MVKALLSSFGSRKVWRVLAAFLLGSLGALALPPLYLMPFAFVSISGLLWLLGQISFHHPKRAFEVGWGFGFGYFVVGLYWIVFALGIDLWRFFWLVPFALFGLPAVLALFPALAVLCVHLSRTKGLGQCLVLSVLWGIFDWLRGHCFTEFPWNLLGYSWMPWQAVLQMTSVIGIYGLTVLTVLGAGLPYVWFEQKKAVQKPLGVIALMFCAAIGGGQWRLYNAPPAPHQGDIIRIVQPNIPQANKWEPRLAGDHFLKLMKLSFKNASPKIKFIVWPESAVPFFLDENPEALGMIARQLPQDGLLFTGAPRRIVGRMEKTVQIWNSLLVINPQGQVVGVYDKSHLVPFGEYVPFRAYVPSWITKVTYGSLDYSAGKGVQTLTPAAVPAFSPLICYEVIFPHAVVSRVQPRPKWLLNLTNDAWYGYTSGPFQHFAIAQVRAIEEGLPLVRAANTGISGVIDAYGRVVARLGLNQVGVLDAALPPPLPYETLYARYGDALFVVVLVVLGSLSIFCVRRGW